MAKKKEKNKILYVQILEAKPNKLFTEQQRGSIRFLRYNKFIPCLECKKKRKVMWTMLCEFLALDFNQDIILSSNNGTVHPPLTPVCSDHPLQPKFMD